MERRPPSPRSRRLFALIGLGVVGVAFLAVRHHQRLGVPVPEWPLAVDLFVTVPLAYLLLLRPAPQQALLGLAALFAFGVLIGSLLLPPEGKRLWLWLEPLRWVALAGLVAWQVWVLAQIGRGLATAPRGENLEQRLHAGFEGRFGAGAVTELLKLEGRMWLYALCRDTSRLGFPEPGAFNVHRQGENASNQLGFLVLMAVELPVAHVLLHLFSPVLALVVSAATLYGLLFLYAEYRATRLRPITVSGAAIHLRYGLLVDALLPMHAIVEVLPVTAQPRRARRRLRLTGMGRANVLLRLAAGTRLKTPFGERETTELYLGVDEPGRFMQAVRPGHVR